MIFVSIADEDILEVQNEICVQLGQFPSDLIEFEE